MSDFEKLFSQIKQLATVVTDENYNEYSKQGYDILMRIHDSGMTQNQVYSIFFQYYNRLEDGLSKDWFAEMLDYLCGWCDPEKYIWKNNTSDSLQNESAGKFF